MKEKKSNKWLVLGVIIAAVLLLWWLFAGSVLNEDEATLDMPMAIEQVN